MRSSVTAIKYVVSALLIAVSLVMLGSVADTARATDSTIDVRVCGDTSTATISITQPDSDSTLDEQPVVVSGQVKDVSQVTVMVDGAYSHSLAIARDQTEYQTPVAMSAGTHTIEIVGTDVCSHADPTASVVVTYTPAAPPSSGEDTPTEVTPDSSRPPGGVIVGGDAVSYPNANVGSAQPASPDWVTTLPAPIREMVRATDLYTVAQDGVVVGAVRVAAILSGVVLMVGAGGLAGWFRAKHLDHSPYRRLLTLQLIGLGLILLALLI